MILRSRSSIPSSHCRPPRLRRVYRSDGSGTNFLFTDYQSKQSPKFKDNIGCCDLGAVAGGHRRQGNEGLANQTTQTDGAIGYVEFAYAKQNKMANCC